MYAVKKGHGLVLPVLLSIRQCSEIFKNMVTIQTNIPHCTLWKLGSPVRCIPNKGGGLFESGSPPPPPTHTLFRHGGL